MQESRKFGTGFKVAGRIIRVYPTFEVSKNTYRELLLDCSTPRTDENSTVVLTTDEPRMFDGLRKGQYIQAAGWLNASFWGEQNEFHNLLWVRHLFTQSKHGAESANLN